MFWHPATCKRGRALYSSNPEILARFVKESALNKREMLPDLDHVDVTARQETLTACQGQPVLVQVPLVPSYALTVHKTQALSIKHIVRGCLEGVFAMGQVYVLFSRVTDPRHLELIGHLCFFINRSFACDMQRQAYLPRISSRTSAAPGSRLVWT